MSTHDGRRFIVIGAGAIGGTVGGALALAGVPVVLAARGRHAEVLADSGLTLKTPDGAFQVAIDTVRSPDELTLTPRDVLVFATKTQQLDTALPQWVDAPVTDGRAVLGTAGELLPVFTALNGVSAEEAALRYFRRVFGVCVWMPAQHLQPGVVSVRAWPVAGQFHIARWPAQQPAAEDTDLLEETRRVWTAAGVRVQLPQDVAPWKYNKLLSNLTNITAALVDPDSDAGDLVAAVVQEGSDVLTRAGIDFVSFDESTRARRDGPVVREVPGEGPALSNSTLQSLSRQTGNVETDFLNGEIVRLAHRHGVAAPLNAGLSRLAREALRHGWQPGRFSAAELADALTWGN